MPDVASYASYTRNGGKHGRANWTGRFSSVGGEDVGGRGRDGVAVPPAESALGLAYDQLFAKRGRLPRAGRPTKAKAHSPY